MNFNHSGYTCRLLGVICLHWCQSVDSCIIRPADMVCLPVLFELKVTFDN